MHELIHAIIAGLTAFVATNIDDLLMLVVFLTQISNQRSGKSTSFQHVVVGQYLGFGFLILASLPGFLGGFMVPRPWLGWLGLFPVAVGISHLLRKSTRETNIQVVTSLGKRRKLLSFIDPQIFQVAAATVGNGGDNIATYIPLFANSNLNQLLVILVVFIVMIAVWLGIAYSLTRHPLVIKTIDLYGKQIVPIVLIVLGIYILITSGAYTLLDIGI